MGNRKVNIGEAAKEAVAKIKKEVEKAAAAKARQPEWHVAYCTAENGWGSAIFRLPDLSVASIKDLYESLKELRGEEVVVVNVFKLDKTVKMEEVVPIFVRRSIEQLLIDAERREIPGRETIATVEDWLQELKGEG